MMTALPNTAFYQSGTTQAQLGIRMKPLFNVIKGIVEPGIILGTRRHNDHSIIWPFSDQKLDISCDKILQASIIYSEAPGQDGPHPFLAPYGGEETWIVLVQTGLRKDSVQPKGERPPLFHGVVPITGGAHEIATWCSKEFYPQSDVPIRRMSLYILTREAKLLVSDIFRGPFQECCLGIEKDVVQVQDLPQQARELVEKHRNEIFKIAA